MNSFPLAVTEMLANKLGLTQGDSAVTGWLTTITIWYLTSLLAALGFSLGFLLVRPTFDSPREARALLDAFTWMDGCWYKQIATEGYHYDPGARSNVAFSPIYPLLGRAVIAITGLPAEAALLIVSNLSLLGALTALYFYVRARFRDAPSELADWVVLAAALFPAGCFFRLAYSESTFMLLAVISMYGIMCRWPLWATAIVIGLATAARPVGIALLVPFAICAVRASRAAVAERRFLWLTAVARSSVYLPLACWGLLAFMVYQHNALGDALASIKVQQHWFMREPVPWNQRAFALGTLEPILAVYDGDSATSWASFDRHGIPWFSLQFANPLFFIGSVTAIAIGAWRGWLSVEETALAGLLLFIPYLTRAYEMGMGSSARFTMVVFPIYIVLAKLLLGLPGAVRAAVAALCGFFVAAGAALYAAAYTIF